MTKDEAIQRVNKAFGSPLLHAQNTIWASTARYGPDEGWWLNIPLLQFKKEIHILLNNEKAKSFKHLRIKASEILSPAMKFRCKDQVAEAFISAANTRKMADILQGGTKHNFSKHVIADYPF